MDFKQVSRPTPGKVAAQAVQALIVGTLLPLLSVFQISLLVPVLMLGGIFAAKLWARGGRIPVVALLASALGSTAWFMGAQMALMLLLASLVPSVVVMRGMAARMPFFRQVKAGVISYAVGLVASMLIAYASFGGNMVVRFVDLMRAEYDRMPDAALQPFVEWANSMIGMGGGQRMTVELFRGQLSGILDLLQQTYAQMLPGTLLSGALLSGVLTVLWGNWTMARQGMATNESFVGMSGWFLPAQLSLGALGLWAVGLVLMYGGYEAGSTVYLTIAQLVGAAFAVQALSALDRRLMRSDMRLGGRRALIAMFAVLALVFRGVGATLCYIGAASALFGSHGAIRLWLKNKQDDSSDHDDFGE